MKEHRSAATVRKLVGRGRSAEVGFDAPKSAPRGLRPLERAHVRVTPGSRERVLAGSQFGLI
jgi:hypothetical protein